MTLPLKTWRILAFLGTVSYPLVVYFCHDKIPPAAFIILALFLIGLRLVIARRAEDKVWGAALGIAIIFIGATFFLNAALAVKAYPVIISLSFAAIFALSLIHPPTIIERLARISEPNLPPEGVIYTRKVTITWVIFLIINASISAATAIWGTLEQWTLWNSLLSYIAMGTLFAIEYLIRRKVKRK